MKVLLPFDSHNHVHMGPSPPIQSLLFPVAPAGVKSNDHNDDVSTSSSSQHHQHHQQGEVTVGLCGMAIMSTHPRDYNCVIDLSKELPLQVSATSGVSETTTTTKIVPGFGVHPWFLHELTDHDWEEVQAQPSATAASIPNNDGDIDNDDSNDDNNIEERSTLLLPRWIVEMENMLLQYPQSIVGEIGIDGFHYDPITRDLTCPIPQQLQAFELQLDLATKLQRPVSIHIVKSFGPLMDTISKVKKSNIQRRQQKNSNNKNRKNQRQPPPPPPALPPKFYFHAFGGKAAVVDQLVALCGDSGTKEGGDVYFGFAPIINFRSPKTAEIIRKVGLSRLVLETDHEDAGRVPSSIRDGIQFLSEALDVDESVVIEQTTKNAFELYGID